MRKNLIITIAIIVLNFFTKSVKAETDTYCKGVTHCVLEETKKHSMDKDIEDDLWREQLLPISEAIDSVTRSNEEKAMLITLGEFESRFARYVLENRCSDGPRGKNECDKGRAKGPWQQWSFPTRQVPDAFDGQAESAIRLLRGFYYKCNGWQGAFSAYATGGKCNWKHAKNRVKRFYSILSKIYQKEQAQKMEIEKIKELRILTGLSLNDCKRALEKAGGSVNDAVVYLQGYSETRSKKINKNKTQEGRIHAYIHNGGQIASMIEVNCETDFASKSKEFEEFCENMCIQITAMQPTYIYKTDISAEQIELQNTYLRNVFTEILKDKPSEFIEKVLEDKMQAWYKECVLTEQTSISNQSKTVSDLVSEISAKLSENVVISRFERWSIR